MSQAKMSALILGSSGQLGSYATEVFSQAGYDVVAPKGRSQLDLTDGKAVDMVIYRMQPDILVNYAGNSNPKDFKDTDFAGNILIVDNILSALARFSRHTRALFMSSLHVFGNNASRYQEWDECCLGFQDERTERLPLNQYGKSKLICDRLVMQYRNSHRLNVVNVIQYGAESVRRRDGGFLFNQLREWVKNAKQGNYYSLNELGKTYKEVMHAKDAAIAHLHIARSTEHYPDYVVGSGAVYTVRDLVNSMINILSLPVSADDIVAPPGFSGVLLCSDARRIQKLGWQPQYTIHNILEEICESS